MNPIVPIPPIVPTRMQATQPPPPLGIAFDTGMARASDALALAMLYGLNGKNEARLLSVTVSGSNLQAAAYCEVVGQFYAGAVSGAFGGAARTLPVGLSIDGKLAASLPLFTAPLARRDAEGRPTYQNTIRKMNDTADPVAVIRNALTTQPDGNAVILASGPATTLAHLLSLKASRETLTTKCKTLVIAAGDFSTDGEPEMYVRTDPPALRKVLADWPTPVVLCGAEIGRALPYPGSSMEKDFAWSPAHPVVDAYRAENPGSPVDVPSAVLAAILYTARAKEAYFKVSEPGRVEIAPDGRTKFTPASGGNHRHLVVDPAQKERITAEYIALATAKPVPRVGRGRGPQ
jgi:hypothetical protein